jgi:hypothetical protein
MEGQRVVGSLFAHAPTQRRPRDAAKIVKRVKRWRRREVCAPGHERTTNQPPDPSKSKFEVKFEFEFEFEVKFEVKFEVELKFEFELKFRVSS